jgi:acetyl esterase
VHEPAPLSPAVARIADRWEREGVPEWHELSVADARELEAERFTPADPDPVAVVRELTVDGPAGPVETRLYRDAAPPVPGLVFYHGGGFTLGTLDSAGDICRALARRGECAVVSVDYRLAPEHPFPAAVADAAAALSAVADDAADLGIDPDRLSVGGTSAGGELAAAVCLRAAGVELDAATDADEPLPRPPRPAGQLLLYPMLDSRTATESYRENADGPFMTAADARWFWAQYGVDHPQPLSAPALAEDDTLAGLPPATVATAGHDPLRDEGLAYADRLAAAGVPVDRVHRPGLAHGYLSMTETVPAAATALDAVAQRVRVPPG